jgi:hypothetical protein
VRKVVSNPTDSLDPDDAFWAVSNSRRRQVILSVDGSTDPVPADVLAVEIAAREKQVAPEAVDSGDRKTVYIALTQVHLETLADLGAIRYDEREKTVKKSDTTDLLAEQIRELTAACEETGGTDAQ